MTEVIYAKLSELDERNPAWAIITELSEIEGVVRVLSENESGDSDTEEVSIEIEDLGATERAILISLIDDYPSVEVLQNNN